MYVELAEDGVVDALLGPSDANGERIVHNTQHSDAPVRLIEPRQPAATDSCE